MYLSITTCLIVCTVTSTLAAKSRYDGYSIWELVPSDSNQVQVLRELQERWPEMAFFSVPEGVGMPVEVLVPPQIQAALRKLFAMKDFIVNMLEENLQLKLSKEDQRLHQKMFRRNFTSGYDWQDFNNYQSIMAEMDNMVTDCPSGFNCTTYSIGSSHEGNDLKVLKISRGTDRKAFWFDSLIHAREWLGGATLLKIMNQLIREYGSDKEATRLLDEYDFYFLPVMNPDGYDYTWTTDRWWRKSRLPHGKCTGTDLNRNYDFDWTVSGSSSNPCSPMYHGPSAASDVETQHVQAEAARIGSSLLAWTSIHTHGNMLLTPFGAKKKRRCVLPSDYPELLKMADVFADAIEKVYKTVWKRGNICDTIYPASGGSIDYMKGVVGVKHNFSPELRGPGFVVEPEAIQLSFDELWAGVVAMIKNIKA